MKSTKKKRSERKLSLSPPGTRHHHLHLRSSSVSPTTSASQNRRLSWPQPPVSDEAGFIVFCFDREDGGFDVVKEEKQKKKDIELSSEKSPRTVNRKVRCRKIETLSKSFKTLLSFSTCKWCIRRVFGFKTFYFYRRNFKYLCICLNNWF